MIVGFREDLPLFGRIKQVICVDPKEILFYLQPIRTNGLDAHVNAFSVETDVIARNVLVRWKALVTHEPVQEITFEDEAYVIVRRSLQSLMD